jgi:hypothetical protein
LIAKGYQVDPLVCLRCGQRMTIVAFVTDDEDGVAQHRQRLERRQTGHGGQRQYAVLLKR